MPEDPQQGKSNQSENTLLISIVTTMGKRDQTAADAGFGTETEQVAVSGPVWRPQKCSFIKKV